MNVPLGSFQHWCAVGVVAAIFFLCGGTAARGQSNFAFMLGGAGVQFDDTETNWGASVGAIAKFNVTRLLLLRTQFNVDRAHLRDVRLDDFQGDQTVTFVCFGIGSEIAYGGKDFNAFAHVTLHGTMRTLSRIITDEQGREKVWDLTRASMGVIGAVGMETFITDNIGIEAQGQYDIYNFDHTPGIDPRYTGIRATLGVQFYLGRNFAR